jgi:osmotically-inducible protein OsmY
MQVSTNSSLTQKIQNAVVHNPHLNHRKIHFRTTEKRVVIEGTAQTYFEKQMAQEALREIEGIESIENQVEVVWS